MSPEDQRVWEEAAETEYAEARPATHGPADAEKVSRDVGERARVARWEYLVQNTASYWPRQKATAAMRLADEEQAALVAENERLRRELGRETEAHRADLLADVEDGLDASDALIEALSGRDAAEAEVERLRQLLRTMDHFAEVAERCERAANESHTRREAAEAKVAKAEALADEHWECDLYTSPQSCITAGPQVLAADGCLPCRLRAALADAPTEQTKGGE